MSLARRAYDLLESSASTEAGVAAISAVVQVSTRQDLRMLDALIKGALAEGQDGPTITAVLARPSKAEDDKELLAEFNGQF